VSKTARILTALVVTIVARANATGTSVDTQETMVLEAAFRWALPRDWAPSSASTVYLAIDKNQDPSVALLGRLRDIANLRKVSECPRVVLGDVEYPKPEAGSVMILLHDFRWHGPSQTRASVGITHYHGPMSAMGCTEYFEFVDGHWTHSVARAGEEVVCGVA